MEDLFRAHWPAVVRYLARRTRNAALAEELAQETFLRAARAFLGWRGDQPLGWLLAIARNVHLDHVRRARRVVSWDDALLSEVPGPPRSDRGAKGRAGGSPARESAADLDLANDIADVLERLPRPTRCLLELVYFDGFSPAEVADMTGIAPGTVRMSLLRARDAFRKKWMEISDE